VPDRGQVLLAGSDARALFSQPIDMPRFENLDIVFLPFLSFAIIVEDLRVV